MKKRRQLFILEEYLNDGMRLYLPSPFSTGSTYLGKFRRACEVRKREIIIK